MIDTLLFDLDNTLLDFDKAEANALTKALGEAGITVTDEMCNRYNKINLAQWKLLEQGILTREEVKLRRFQILFEEFAIDATEEEDVAGYYQRYLGQGHYFIEGAEEVLEELSKKYRIYLVTNGTLSVQTGRLESSGIKKYLQGVFISEEIGYNKPSKEYFEKCFSKIPDFKKENTMIIGDSLSSDIQGGINAGIKTIWFHRSQDLTEDPQPKPDYEIKSLKSLLEMLK
ncbi:YjjG family noncanonical pyrimidine nucleotidase [Anaerostipes sp.]|uniref:YjjG family noncanonical pyrimidine nucleotidase n=1 Tax=Anaerostipes sp. TaxID=1872530 RepID=UPI003966BB3E